ncbi:hypothetical protein [uncultured Rothia sp.]|uniref:hypothetical protein n=1 Tax=uncultured Rothia sp. TaxID=316088 RepID=UPI00260BA3DE|nr:hypothetical protein [uncultured Rothia sp.]
MTHMGTVEIHSLTPPTSIDAADSLPARIPHRKRLTHSGVFHTGSYTTPMSGGTNQNKPMRMGVRNLHIRTNKYNLQLDSKSNQIFLEKHCNGVFMG